MGTDVKTPGIRRTDRTLELWDPIERSTVGFGLSEAVSLESESTDIFHFPVETAVRFSTDRLLCETVRDVHVWTDDGSFVAESTNGEPLYLPAAPDGTAYIFDVAAPIKAYFRTTSPLQITSNATRTSIRLEPDASVSLGIRSFHHRPAGEIVVADRPYSVLEALSYLGDSLKTTSSERSFPSMRGHPPRLVRGDELEIPDGIEKPNTGIRLELPPAFRYLYPAASLAYYLGADVVPAAEPRLVAADREIPLGEHGASYDETVAQLLQHLFFMDCLTRTEGYFQVPLYERQEFEQQLAASETGPDTVPFAELYQLPIDECVARYLEVPFELTEGLVPEWRLTADVEPDVDYLEALPYLASDLAIIRCPDPTPIDDLPETPTAIQDFCRSGSLESAQLEFVDVPSAHSVEQTFVGGAKPIAASKSTVESFEARLERSGNRSGTVSLSVVVNDEQMCDELEAVEATYSVLEETGASIDIRTDVGVDDLESLFRADRDFLHYIGHVTDDGIECPDGHFNTTAGGEYGTDAFILNGCQSYVQGEGLVDGGCIGGVVTTSDVLNDPAVEIGATFARLLTDGFSLRAATTIASKQRIVGNQYLVIGNGDFRVTERQNTTPMACQLEKVGSNEFNVTIKTYPNGDNDIGCLFTPHLPGIEHRYLSSGVIDTINVPLKDLTSFFSGSGFPVEYDGELIWSGELLDQL